MNTVGMKFIFTLQTDLILGTAKTFTARDFTMGDLGVYRLVANAPCEGFVKLIDVSADRLILPPFYSNESKDYLNHDAFDFRSRSDDGSNEFSPCICRHGASMVGEYSGLVPNGFKSGSQFPFCVSLVGRGI